MKHALIARCLSPTVAMSQHMMTLDSSSICPVSTVPQEDWCGRARSGGVFGRVQSACLPAMYLWLSRTSELLCLASASVSTSKHFVAQMERIYSDLQVR